MITVGLTGGIGSGKTTVAKKFKDLGVPVYIADVEAKKLMNRSKIIRRHLVRIFGEAAYIDNTLNKPFLAAAIFNDKALLQQMNAVVHPKVAKHFLKWKSKQEAPYVISEVAILFENGSYKNYDFIITVTAPEDDRIARVIKRDSSTKEKVKAIISNQWSDEDKIKLSDYVIENIDLEIVEGEVLEIHKKMIEKTLNS